MGLDFTSGASQMDSLLLSQDAAFQGPAIGLQSSNALNENPSVLTIDGLGFTDVADPADGAPNGSSCPSGAPLSQF